MSFPKPAEFCKRIPCHRRGALKALLPGGLRCNSERKPYAINRLCFAHPARFHWAENLRRMAGLERQHPAANPIRAFTEKGGGAALAQGAPIRPADA
jgi:hypothetical protein